MKLTRREAVAALAAAGLTAAGGAAVVGSDRWREVPSDGGPDDHELESLAALAEVLYPSPVTVTDEFLETYVTGRTAGQPAYREEVEAALAFLDRYAVESRGSAFAGLSVDERDAVLRALGMVDVEPVPDGTERQRVRYYLVNDLLFALFATPTGGELVGAENPRGYPGGLAAYQRGPRE